MSGSKNGARAEDWALVGQAVDDVERWIEERDFLGHDPFDALLSPLALPLRPFRWPSVVLTQIRKRSRWDLSGLLGISPHENPKALALGVHADLHQGYPDAADGLLYRLASLQQESGGWGYPFPWANRHFAAPAGTPSGVVTAFVCRAFIHRLGFPGGDPPKIAPVLEEARRFVRESLLRIPAGNDAFLFSYTPGDRRGVHNASLLAAEVLATVPAALAGGQVVFGKPYPPSDLTVDVPAGDRTLVVNAVNATLSAQRSDGLWPYGASSRDMYVDSYHTGYVLSSLRRIRAVIAPDDALASRIDRAIAEGLAAWEKNFLAGPGVAWRPGTPTPVELHGVAQGILTLIEFQDLLDNGRERALDLALWAIRNARRPDGAFYYLWHPRRPNRNAYLRWTQAWMFCALATLDEEQVVA